LIILPLQNHGKEHQLTLSGLPQSPPIDSAPQARLFACWWQQELHIWKVGKSYDEQSHRKVAQLSLQGEENIADAALSPDGSYIAVVTTAELRIFKISITSKDSNRYHVQRITTTKSAGGRLVKFSSDGKWLVVVSNANEVKLARFVVEDEIGLNFQNLNRLFRQDKRQTESLGDYIRTINRICFSADSKMLAVSDLAGYIDSWVLTETESILPKQNGASKHNGHMTDSDSESEPEDEAVFDHFTWKPNPASEDLPQLDSPAIAISFRGVNSSKTETQTLGNNTELFVLTANHHIREFDLSTGSFTEWSKRNPRNVLPEAFQSVRDRGMGLLWNPNGWLWVYGAQWVFGLDTTVDHKAEDAKLDHQKKKRKRGQDGAGGRVRPDEVAGMAPDEDEEKDQDQMDLDSDEDIGALMNGVEPVKLTNGASKDVKTSKWYMTFKYRPILGIVPMQKTDDKELEVVLVERPLWDLDLPGRFESIHAR
jgi:U3 small nucleolar RNA-associated protein 4